jgi:hypothetical protein
VLVPERLKSTFTNAVSLHVKVYFRRGVSRTRRGGIVLRLDANNGPVDRCTMKQPRVLWILFPVVIHHFLRNILLVANWRRPAGPTVGA